MIIVITSIWIVWNIFASLNTILFIFINCILTKL